MIKLTDALDFDAEGTLTMSCYDDDRDERRDEIIADAIEDFAAAGTFSCRPEKGRHVWVLDGLKPIADGTQCQCGAKRHGCEGEA